MFPSFQGRETTFFWLLRAKNLGASLDFCFSFTLYCVSVSNSYHRINQIYPDFDRFHWPRAAIQATIILVWIILIVS